MDPLDQALIAYLEGTGPDRQGPVTSVALGERVGAVVDAMRDADPVAFGAQSRAIREIMDRGIQALLAERPGTKDAYREHLRARRAALAARTPRA